MRWPLEGCRADCPALMRVGDTGPECDGAITEKPWVFAGTALVFP